MHTRGTFPSHFRIPMMGGINYWYLQTMGGKDGFSRSELLQFSPSSATLQPHLNPSSSYCYDPHPPQNPSFLALLEVSHNPGFSFHRPPSSPTSPPAPSHPFSWSYKHFLCLVPPTFWDFSIRFPSSPTPSNSPPDFPWDLLPIYLTLSPTSQGNYSLNCIPPHPSNRPPSS